MLRYYIWTICICMALISCANVLFVVPNGTCSLWYAISGSVINTVAVIILDGIIAYIIHKLPNKWFSPYNKCFHVKAWERKLFEKIKIRKWKDKVPEMGRFLCNFDKTKIALNSNEYLYQFLEETCYAGAVHIGMLLIGFVLLAFPLPNILTITLPVVIVNFVLQIPPILIQRYNRPKLLIAYERNKKNTK